MRWNRPSLDRPVQLLDSGKGRRRVDVARDHQNRVVRRVPILIELLEHGAGGRIERRLRAQRVVRVRRAGEEILVEARNEFVGRIRQVARNLLLNRSALFRPLLLGVLDVLHAGRIQPQRDFQILRRHGDEILSDGLLRIRVLAAAQFRIDRGDLIRAQSLRIREKPCAPAHAPFPGNPRAFHRRPPGSYPPR